MGQFLGALKPSIMNCNCICTVSPPPPFTASAYIQYTYITKFSVKLSYAKDFPYLTPHPQKTNLVSWAFERGNCQGTIERKDLNKSS